MGTLIVWILTQGPDAERRDQTVRTVAPAASAVTGRAVPNATVSVPAGGGANVAMRSSHARRRGSSGPMSS